MDILVNNAGVTQDGLIMRMSDEDWDTVMNTNLKGALRLRKCFRAIFFGSVRAHHQCRFGHWLDRQRRAMQLRRQQGGFDRFTKSVARELGSRGITVNALAPGIETDMTAALSGKHARNC